ncbi:MAG: efflux RND transporter periplasmic adaptor subunit [Alphaproteobacteria bacterium]|nr:efflux RND transporter periplasmic adaptor subunit [Alphaproteobacteria bacterium]
MRLGTQAAIIASLTVVTVGAWLALSSWDGGAKPSKEAALRSSATPVLVESLELKQDQVVVRAVGTGEALRSASIHPKVTGKVVEILFEADQRVTKGMPLLRLDDEHERLTVRLAQVAEKEAKRQLDRLTRLAKSGSVSIVQLETAQTEYESATIRLAQAQANLADRVVVAPFDGVIGLSDMDIGDRVTEETLIATLDDRSSILVEFAVPEEYVGRIKLGGTVVVRPWMDWERKVHGTVSATDSRIDQATRSMRVQARIPNLDDAIRPGTAFDVQMSFIGKAFPSVREVAVSWSGDGAYLWRIVDGKADKVFVNLVRRDEGTILVDGPLAEGDRIVVEGVQGLRDGQAVDARAWSGAAASTEAPS